MKLQRTGAIIWILSVALLACNATHAGVSSPGGASPARASPARASLDLNRFSKAFAENASLQESIRKFESLERLRASAQISLESLLKKNPGNEELSLRYAELLLQRARDLELLSIDVAIADRRQDSINMKASAQRLARRALGLHASILKKHPNHPLAGTIYLSMGRTELSLKNPKGALNDADTGLKNVAKSPAQKNVSVHLWLLKGDVSFELLQAGPALEAYGKAKALATPGSIEDSYAIYRMAWALYNLKDPSRALGLLDTLLDTTKDKLALRAEAVKDYGLFAADLPEKEFKKRGGAAGIFKRIAGVADKESAIQAVDRMAQVIAKNRDPQEAVHALEFLINGDKLNVANLEMALTIVDWSHKFADRNRLTVRYLWLLKEFGPGSMWFEHHRLSPEIQETASTRIERILRDYSVGLHKEAKEMKSEEVRRKYEDNVLKLYEAHLRAFPDVPSVHFYSAEIYRERDRFADAGRNYDAFIRLLSLVKDEALIKADRENRDESIRSSAEVWALAVDKDAKNAPEMIASIDQLVARYPKLAKAPKLLMVAARAEAQHGTPANALGRLSHIVEAYPKTPEAVEAVETSLDLLNKEKDLSNLTMKATMWMASLNVWAPEKDRARLRTSLANLQTKSEGLNCEALIKVPGRELESALCLVNFARRFGGDVNLAPRAYLTAADQFDRARDPNGAAEALEELIRVFPKTPQAAGAFARLASLYEKSFQFEKALRVYQIILRVSGAGGANDKVFRRQLTLLKGLGHYEELVRVLKAKSTSASIRHEFASSLNENLFDTLLREEDSAGYRQGILASVRGQSLLAQFRRLKSVSETQRLELTRIEAQMALSRGDGATATRTLSRALSTNSKSVRRNPSYAKLKLMAAQMGLERLKTINIVTQLKDKAKLFQLVETELAHVVQSSSQEAALAALLESGRLYAHMAQSLEEAKGNAKEIRILRDQALKVSVEAGRRARQWKAISPALVAAFKTKSQENSRSFPWVDLPRWLDLSSVQSGLEEWGWSDSKLVAAMSKKSARASAKNAAFVLFVRRNSDVDPELAAWVSTFSDRAGIQARIQAMLADGQEERAALFLSQYETLFAKDAFAEHLQGRVLWSRGDYKQAYNVWTQTRFRNDFRARYYALGWTSLYNTLEGKQRQQGRAIFSELAGLARETWQKHYLASVCALGQADCASPYRGSDLVELLEASVDERLGREFNDGRSAFTAKRIALTAMAEERIAHVTREEDVKAAKTILEALRDLKDLAIDESTIEQEYDRLKGRLDHKKDELEAKEKVVAEVKS